MTMLNRRNWLRKSLLASTLPLVGGAVPLTSMFPSQSSNLNVDIQENILRLNWNENPYGPGSKSRNAMVGAMDYCNLYPDDLVQSLKEKLAGKYDLEANQIMLTAGSTEILSLLGQHVALQQGEILIPWPSFPTMILFGERCGAITRKVPLDKDTIDLKALQKSIGSLTKMIFLCNPNNPTSTELGSKDLKKFCRQVPEDILICVDEAYIEYSKHGLDNSLVSLVDELPNLIICRTFSKAYGLAGLRIGYAMSNASNINALRERHTGWELSAGVVTLQAAIAAMDDDAFLNHCVLNNREGKGIVYRAFDKWGVGYSYSSTNFIYAESSKFDPEVVMKLKEENILITKWPDMTDHIRISIGRPEEMKLFVETVEKYVIA